MIPDQTGAPHPFRTDASVTIQSIEQVLTNQLTP
jgi:hypothetical protein